MSSNTEQEMEPMNPRVFRNVMGTFATGVAVVTAEWDNTKHGMTMNSLTSVSLDPCMLLVCPRRGSATGNAILKSGNFVVNVLAEGQHDLSHRFIGNFEDRFLNMNVEASASGPLLSDALAHIGCRVSAVHAAGDHDIVIGEAMFFAHAGGAPLVFYKGEFGRFSRNPRKAA